MDLVDVMLIAGGGVDNDLMEEMLENILFIETDTMPAVEGDNHGEQEELD
jgi:hypothetical protein